MYSLVYKYIFLILTVELSKIESKGMKTKNQSIINNIFSRCNFPLRDSNATQCSISKLNVTVKFYNE